MNRIQLQTVLSVLLVFGLLLGGCAVPVAPTGEGEAPAATVLEEAPASGEDALANVDPSGQEIVFWHVSTRTHEEVLMDIIESFNETNEWGITVVPEYAGYYDDIYKKILTAISAGGTPDLAVAYANQVAEYAQAGVIQPLDPYINHPQWGLSEEDREDFFEAFLQSDRQAAFDDQLMSFAHSRSMQVMYYNITALQELGFSGEPPQTWDEFIEMSCAAADAGMGGYAYAGGASLFAGMVFSLGGDIVNENGTEATFDGEAGVEALRILQELFERGCAYEVAEQYGDQTDFANGNAIFNFGSTAGLPYYRDAINQAVEEGVVEEFEWSVAPPPHSTEEPVVDVYGPSVTIFDSTPEKELAAWLFLKYWAEPENVTRWATVANYFPIRQSAIESNAMQEYLAANPEYEKAFGFLQYGEVEPNVAGWQEIRGILEDVLKQVIEGGDPQEVLGAAAERANEILAEQQ